MKGEIGRDAQKDAVTSNRSGSFLVFIMTTPHSGGVVSIGFAGILSLSEFSLRECLAQTAAQNRIKFAHNVS